MAFQTRGTYQEHNGKAEILFSTFGGYPTTAAFEGNPSAQKVEVKWYQYSLSPEISQQIVDADSRPALPGGEIDVGEVSELRLVSETNAQCRFSWEALLNATGTAVLGTGKQNGTGAASFSKKPDGSWVLDEWRLK
jgi:hypothetical protein